MVKKALIFGITGQNGSYLAEFLLEKGYIVYGLVRRSSTSSLSRLNNILDKVHLISGDLLDQSSIIDAIAESMPDEIYNLASQSYIPTSWTQPALTAEYTAIGVSRILESIRRIKPDAKFYQASSSEMFGQPKESPQTEETPFRPRNPYGTAKAYAHWLTVNYREKYNLFACCGISYTHESPRRGYEFVFRKITRAAAMARLGLLDTLELGNLDDYRDWSYAVDAVEAMWMIMQQSHPDDYIIASGKAHSVRELLEGAFSYVGLNCYDYLKINPSLCRPAEKVILVGNINKIKSHVGWQPKTDFHELIQIMIEYELESIGDKLK